MKLLATHFSLFILEEKKHMISVSTVWRRVLIIAVTGKTRNQRLWPLSLAETLTGELDTRLQHLLLWQMLRVFDWTVVVKAPGNQKCLFFCRPAWKAPIISPGLRSQPPIRCLKNNEWFLQHVGHSCFLFPEAPRLRIGCRDIMSFSPLSPIFPKLKTHRPERLNDVKQTLFTHICAPKCFFSPPEICAE